MQNNMFIKSELNIMIDSAKSDGYQNTYVSPNRVDMGDSKAMNVVEPYCRKKLEFGIVQSSTSNSLSQSLNEKLRKSKKNTAIVTGTVQSSNNSSPLKHNEMMSGDLINSYSAPSTNGISKNYRNQFPKLPSNTKRNARERKRVRTINDYFSQLQRYLPHAKQSTSSKSTSVNSNKKLSKVETLKAAIDYIEYLLKYAHQSPNFTPNPSYNQDVKNNINMLTPSSSSSSSSTSSSSPLSTLSSPASSITSNSSAIADKSKLLKSSSKPVSNCSSPASQANYALYTNSSLQSTSKISKSEMSPVSLTAQTAQNSKVIPFKLAQSNQTNQSANSYDSTSNTYSYISQTEPVSSSVTDCEMMPYQQSTSSQYSANNFYLNNSPMILNQIDFNVSYNNYNINGNPSCQSAQMPTNSTSNAYNKDSYFYSQQSQGYNQTYNQNYSQYSDSYNRASTLDTITYPESQPGSNYMPDYSTNSSNCVSYDANTRPLSNTASNSNNIVNMPNQYCNKAATNTDHYYISNDSNFSNTHQNLNQINC